jgi:hypothetical protein
MTSVEEKIPVLHIVARAQQWTGLAAICAAVAMLVGLR